MAPFSQQASTQCPKTKIVMAGYSQGSQVVHSAADTLKSNPTATKQVAAGELPLISLWLTDGLIG